MSHLGKKFRSKHIHIPAVFIVALASGALGTYLLSSSFAADYSTNHNPDGIADYCALENNNTVVYGWANDQDAASTPGPQPYVKIVVGSSSVTTPSSISGYRNTQINSWIKTARPGQPTSSIYGWRAQFSGLYKGTVYAISGTVLNYGAGTNTALLINSGHNVDNDTTKPYFPGKIIPDACLATKPLPTPLPSPTPAPAPTKSTPKPVTPPSVIPSNVADATLAIGSFDATFTIPAGNAAKVHVLYGADPAKMTSNTLDQSVIGDSTSVNLGSLQAKTAYTFQIVRTSSTGNTANSPSVTFVTKGYDIVLTFTSNGKPVKGIKGDLNYPDLKATSDTNGNLKFANLNKGTYLVSFTYKGQSYNQEVSTDTVNSNSINTTPQTATARSTVNLDHIATVADKTAPAQTQHKSSSKATVIIIVLIVSVIATVIWFIPRHLVRTPKKLTPEPATTSDLPLPSKTEIKSVQKKSTQKPPEPRPEHIGESLREMVIKSMHEEATRRRKPPKDQ